MSEQFIVKAIQIHGDKYDYSKVNYINSKTKVVIICKDHGNFEQQPSNHLYGYGCKYCGYNKSANACRGDKNKFIENAKNIHGDKYDYSKVIYNNIQTKIIITCKDHGDFTQQPNNHISNKQGCPKCGILYQSEQLRYNNKIFIEKACQTHGDIYDYSITIYEKSDKKISIICKEHGVFTQTPSHHLNGQGCKICGFIKIKEKATLTEREFIEKAKKVHGEKFDYTEINYVSTHKNINIRCLEHNINFEQHPSNHLSGSIGCNKCSFKKYSKAQMTWLIFMEKYYNIKIQHAENEGEYKITSRMRADGYCKLTNTIYEFHGDFWHGNPKKYNEHEINTCSNKFFGELYQNTLKKEKFIRDSGYNLIVIWENDWNKINNSIRTFQRLFRNSKHHFEKK